MSQILKDLNKLAVKMGAPVVGQNISEQLRAISTFYEGTSHGANISERVNEIRSAYHAGGGKPTLIEKSIIQNGIYSAIDDEADGYSKVSVNIPDAKTKWLMSHGTEFIRIPKEDLAFTDKPAVAMKLKVLEPEVGFSGSCQLFGGWSNTGAFIVEYDQSNSNKPFIAKYTNTYTQIYNISLNNTVYVSMGYNKYIREMVFNSSEEPIQQIIEGNYIGGTNTEVTAHDLLIYSAMSYTDETQWNISKAKIAYLHLYDNNVLIFDGVPKVDPTTGKACLYDSISGKYYGNANASSPTDFEIVEED